MAPELLKPKAKTVNGFLEKLKAFRVEHEKDGCILTEKYVNLGLVLLDVLEMVSISKEQARQVLGDVLYEQLESQMR